MDGRMGVSYKPGGRMIAMNAPLRLLIQFAYAAHDSPHQGHSSPAGFSGGGRSGLDRFRGLRYRGQAGGQHRSEAGVADAANAPGRQVQADAPPGDERASCLRFDGEKERPQTAGGEGSKLRFLSARHDAADDPREGRLWLCAVAAVVHRAANEGRKLHMADLVRESGNDTGPAGPG